MEETVSTPPSTVVGTTPGVLRLINSRAILDELFRDDASRTVTELSRTVGLSRPTVEAALADLVDEGWVAEAEAIATPNKAGRRAKRFAADASAGAVLGVDLGLHGIVGLRADLRGVTTARVEEHYADLTSAEQAWSSVQDVVQRLTEGVAPDRVLAAAAQYLIVNLRPYDKLFRYGGEEFLLCLPDTDLATSHALVERLREGLAAQKIPVDGHAPIGVTMSFGVARLEPAHAVEQAIAHADEAMYEAKRMGRNCTRVWAQSRPAP